MAKIMWSTECVVTVTDEAPPAENLPSTPEQLAELHVFEQIKDQLIGGITTPYVSQPPPLSGPKRLIRLKRTEISSLGNGIPNWFYEKHDINPFQNDHGALSDSDADGLSTLEELAAGTNPSDEDSDDDGATDGYEKRSGTDGNNENNCPPIFRWLARSGDFSTTVSHPQPTFPPTATTQHGMWIYGENIPENLNMPWNGAPDFSHTSNVLKSVVGLPEIPTESAHRGELPPTQHGDAWVETYSDFTEGRGVQPILRVWLEQKPAPLEPVTRTYLHRITTAKGDITADSNSWPRQNKFETLNFTIPASPAPIDPQGTAVASAYKDLAPALEDMFAPQGIRGAQMMDSGISRVEFNLFHGQNASQMIPEDKEETVGAYTVANLNDTDGDGTIDNVDTDVKAAPGAVGVSDEVDLMKLEIKGPTTGRMKVTVVGGAVKFWEKNTKEAAIALTSGVLFINASELPKTLWIEATAVSASVRDIHLKLGYEPPNNGAFLDDIDQVKATAVWVTQGEVKFSGSSLWQQCGDPLRSRFESSGFAFGPENLSVGGGLTPARRDFMGMEWIIAPSGINYEVVKFDVTRQVVSLQYRLGAPPLPAEWQLLDRLGWGGEPITQTGFSGDSPNDDTASAEGATASDSDDGPADEDNTPNQDRIYHYDSPGIGNRPWPGPFKELIQQFNASDYVTVRFDGKRPSGVSLDASRCSQKFQWHSFWQVREDGSGPNDPWLILEANDPAKTSFGPGHKPFWKQP